MSFLHSWLWKQNGGQCDWASRSKIELGSPVIQGIYLHNLLKPLNKTRNLRSSDDDQLVVPRVSSKMGERAFAVAAPQLWNCIPLEIKKSKSSESFRKKN